MNKIYDLYKPFIELKNVKRAGWLKWVNADIQTESVASHIASCNILNTALLYNRNLQHDLEIGKTTRMLALHELGELVIGDITPFDGKAKLTEKMKEASAVKQIIAKLNSSCAIDIYDVWKEFESNITPISKFCKDIDKVDCVLQSKFYTNKNAVITYNEFFNKYGEFDSNLKLNQYKDCYDSHYHYWKAKINDKSMMDLSDIEQQFYEQCCKLKDMPRRGWVLRNIDKPETVAEHVYGTQILSEILNSELNLGCDMNKVSAMLALHELGETIIGDITPLDKITNQEKQAREDAAVKQICNGLKNGNKVYELWKEFEYGATNETNLAKLSDKLEAVYMAKYYVDQKKANPNIILEFSENYKKGGNNLTLVEGLCEPMKRNK